MYACSADPSLSDFRSWLHSGPLWWEAINQNKALAVWWKMSWVCWGAAIYRPVGIYYRGWDRRGQVANTPEALSWVKFTRRWRSQLRWFKEKGDADAKTAAVQAASSSGGFPAGSMFAEHGADWQIAQFTQSNSPSHFPGGSAMVFQQALSLQVHLGLVDWISHFCISSPVLLKVHGAMQFSPLCSTAVSLLVLRGFRSVNAEAETGWLWKLPSAAREIIWRCSLEVQ